MSTSLTERIRESMEEKETAELVAIWKKHDRTEWSDNAFEVIREILLERLGNLPVQEETTTDDDTEEDSTDSETVDTYYNFNRLFRVAFWIRKLSWLFLAYPVVVVAAGVLNFVRDSGDFIFNPISAVVNIFWNILIGLFYFALLQGLAEIMFVLMDIEENTRASTLESTGAPKSDG